MRGERTKSILSFQRAVKMNPSYASAWTLMGHEYVELKNISAAILCYQKAIGELNHYCGEVFQNMNFSVNKNSLKLMLNFSFSLA